MLKRKTDELTTHTSNPYLDARREWNAQFGSLAASANNWRLVALVSLCIALGSVVGLVALGASKEVVPYVVVLDETGGLVSSGTPQSQVTQLDQRVVKALVGNFVSNVRTVTADGAAQQTMIKRAYNVLSANDQAYNTINDYMRGEGNPFVRAKDELVSVRLMSILPLSELTYQVEWKETVRDRRGVTVKTPKFQSVLTLRQAQNLTATQQIDNPIGLFVADIKWTKRL